MCGLSSASQGRESVTYRGFDREEEKGREEGREKRRREWRNSQQQNPDFFI